MSEVADPPGEETTIIELSSAGTLTAAEAAELLKRNESRVVAIIGPFDAGKTSLIASLYDLFQNGSVGGVGYARSQTLHAFELACHDARAASRRASPAINRTPRGDVRFYHLDVFGAAAGDRLTTLFADRAGEEYREVSDDVRLAESFLEVARCDVVTVLLDGARLLDTGARHNARSEIRLILQGLVDGGSLGAGKRLAIVLTKQDLVSGSPLENRVSADLDRIASDIQNDFPDMFDEIATFRIAASPADTSVHRGAGIPELFHYWISSAPVPEVVTPGPHLSARAFGRLTVAEN